VLEVQIETRPEERFILADHQLTRDSIENVGTLLVLGERLGGRLLLALMLGSVAVVLLMVPGLGAYARAPLGSRSGSVRGWAGPSAPWC